jgi:hypothetical protein
MSPNDYRVLTNAADRAALLEALPGDSEACSSVEAQVRVLGEIDAILDLHQRALSAGLDDWQTAKARKKAAEELTEFADHLNEALDALDNLGPLARTALDTDVFDPQSVLGEVVATSEQAGLDGGGRKGAMRIYLDHYRALVSMLDSTRPMLQLLAAERGSAKPEDWAARGFDGQQDGPFVPPVNQLPCRALRRYVALARVKAQDLREAPSKRGRHSSAVDRVVTYCLMRIWREYTGEGPSVDYRPYKEHQAEGGAFLEFARRCVRIVDRDYDGQGALREILDSRVRNSK